MPPSVFSTRWIISIDDKNKTAIKEDEKSNRCKQNNYREKNNFIKLKNKFGSFGGSRARSVGGRKYHSI